MAKTKEPVKVNTPIGRLINSSFWERDVYTDEKGEKGEPKYRCEMAFEPNKEFEKFEDIVVGVAIDEWGEGAEDDYFDNRLQSPILDGDDLAERREKKGKSGDVYKGLLVLRASTKFNRHGADGPGGIYVCDENAEELDFASRSQKIYNGCYGIMNVTVVPYDGIGRNPNGITLYLNGFQFDHDGDPIRGTDPSTLFSPLRSAGSESKGRRGRGRPKKDG